MPRRADADSPAPSPGEAHLWVVDLDAATEPPDGVLSAAERERAADRRAPKAARRWAAARWALREVLSRYLGTAPGAIVLARGEHGKPRLTAQPSPLQFNLSHSAGLALVGVAEGGQPIGVDIEQVAPRRDLLALAERALAPAEAAAIAAAPPEHRAVTFYAAWTAHEARLKCGGGGFGGPQPPPDLVAVPVEVGEGYAAAVAVGGTSAPQLRLYPLRLR